MKQAIVVTFSVGAEDTLETFMKAGAEPRTITVFFLRVDNDEGLMCRIKKERPDMVILNGNLHPMTLQRLHEDIGDLIGRHDIACKLYAYEKEIPLPGVEFVTIEKTIEILRN